MASCAVLGRSRSSRHERAAGAAAAIDVNLDLV